jgi:hypothetical protein
MITRVDDRFRREVLQFDLRCTCEWCGAFDEAGERCAYGYPTEPHRRLPVASSSEFVFCKAFELK